MYVFTQLCFFLLWYYKSITNLLHRILASCKIVRVIDVCFENVSPLPGLEGNAQVCHNSMSLVSHGSSWAYGASVSFPLHSHGRATLYHKQHMGLLSPDWHHWPVKGSMAACDWQGLSGLSQVEAFHTHFCQSFKGRCWTWELSKREEGSTADSKRTDRKQWKKP